MWNDLNESKGLSRRKLLIGLGAAGAALATASVAASGVNGLTVTESVYGSASGPGDWVNVRSYGAVGNGVTDDYAAIYNAISENDTVYFPKGTYALGQTLALNNMTGKTLIFHSQAILQQLATVTGQVMQVYGCSHMTFHNLALTTLSTTSSNALNVTGESHHLYFTGITRVVYSRSLAFVLRGNTHTVFIDTYIVEDPETRDGLSLMNCHDVTINTVIGRGNSDDLVVLKAYKETPSAAGGSTYNIVIGKIHSYGCFGAFTIGSEIYDGDVYNVTVGEIVCHNTRSRGLYFKYWNTSGSIPHTRRGRVYNIRIGSFTTWNDVPNKGSIPIHFEVQHDDFMHLIQDVSIGSAMIKGGYQTDLVVIQRCKRIVIDHLVIESWIQPGETRNSVNHRGVYIRNGSEDCWIKGGVIEAVESPLSIIEQSHGNRIENVKLVVKDRTNAIVGTKNLVNVSNSEHTRLVDCDLRSLHSKQVNITASLPGLDPKGTTFIQNNRGRDDRASALPTSGYYYVGERIYNKSPAGGGPIGWVCTKEGDPANWIWKAFGIIEV